MVALCLLSTAIGLNGVRRLGRLLLGSAAIATFCIAAFPVQLGGSSTLHHDFTAAGELAGVSEYARAAERAVILSDVVWSAAVAASLWLAARRVRSHAAQTHRVLV